MPKIMNSKITDDVVLGNNVKIIEPVNIYGCKIDDNVFVGPFVEIQKNVSIGKNTKIQSHTFICEYVEIGKGCFIGHGVKFVNDDFKANIGPAKGNKKLWKSTKISENVNIGSGVVLLPVKICSKTVVGAGAVVTKDITEPGIYAGNPARLLRKI